MEETNHVQDEVNVSLNCARDSHHNNKHSTKRLPRGQNLMMLDNMIPSIMISIYVIVAMRGQ